MKFNTIYCILFIVSQGVFAQSTHKYDLLWTDEFDQDTINGTIWSRLYRTAPNSWGMYMSKSDAVYELHDGVLRLYAKVNDGIEPDDTASYLCGGITTRNKKSIAYGKIECRLKMVGAVGTWPAVWTMPVNYKDWEYPQRAEIDILEYLHRNTYVHQTVHSYFTDELGYKNNPKCNTKSSINYEQYNIYTLEILPEAVILSINGKETFRYPKLSNAREGQFPFGVESYLMLDMQVGGDWVKTVDPSTFPAYMDIDWVKFYKLRK